MKRLIYTMAGLLALNAGALAADMPVKALAVPAPVNDSQWYFGIDTGASVAQPSAGGTNSLFATSLISGKLTAAGGTVGGCVGYIKGSVVGWWGVHSCADYQNITASSAVVGAPSSIASRWSGSVEARFGGTMNPINWLVDALPNLNLTGLALPNVTPTAPPGFNVAATPRGYAAVGIDAFGVTGNFGQLGGASVGIGPMLKSGFVWQTLDKSGQPNGGMVDVFGKIVWPSRGLSIDNVLGTGGAPVVHGAVKMGTMYTAGLGYYFSPR